MENCGTSQCSGGRLRYIKSRPLKEAELEVVQYCIDENPAVISIDDYLDGEEESEESEEDERKVPALEYRQVAPRLYREHEFSNYN